MWIISSYLIENLPSLPAFIVARATFWIAIFFIAIFNVLDLDDLFVQRLISIPNGIFFNFNTNCLIW